MESKTQILLVISNLKLKKALESYIVSEFESVEIIKVGSFIEAKEVISFNPLIELAIVDFGLASGVLKMTQKAMIPTILLSKEGTLNTKEIVKKYNIIDYVSSKSHNFLRHVLFSMKRIIKHHDVNILVVDDSKLHLKTLTDILKEQRFSVFSARDGKEAFEMILEKKVDFSIVMTDYHMPKMDGLELTFEIRKLYGKDELSIIVLSVSNDWETITDFIRMGANDYITKPYTQIEVTTRLNANLEILDLFKKSKELANKDFLTGAYNRRYFFEVGENMLLKAKRADKKLALAMLDIDHFKKINDTYGHDVGDFALKKTVEIFKSNIRAFDLMARVGGEEFCILLEDISLEDTKIFLEKIRSIFEKNVFKALDCDISFTISIGVRYGLDENLDIMLKKADEQLYISKESGRNRVSMGEF